MSRTAVPDPHCRIAELMCEASMSILWPHTRSWVRHRLPNATLTARVGRGRTTYCRMERHGRYTLHYGVGMVRSKLSGLDCITWTTSIEISERGYYQAKLTPVNLFAATCLHEYAHMVDHVRQGTHGRIETRHHGRSFYAILDRMHGNPVANRVREFLASRFMAERLPARFETGETEITHSLADMSRRYRPGQQVAFSLNDGTEIRGSVKRVNQRTITVLVRNGKQSDKYLVSANYLRAV